MTTKKSYAIGDSVWIHGISPSNKLTAGTVIHSIDLSGRGYSDIYYVIEIPCHIEPLLELRSWHSISQDEIGPVGALRNLGGPSDSDHKKMTHLGYYTSSNLESDSLYENGPTPDQIMAALEKSQQAISHAPLNFSKDLIKDTANKPKRKYYNRKKKRESN